MSNTKPVLFNFTDSLDGVNFDEIQAEVDKDGSRGRFINEPGLYTLTVTKVESFETKDPKEGWISFKVFLEDIDGKSTNDMIFVPTTVNIRYPTASGKNELWAIIKLQKFASAVGIDAQGKSIFAAIQKMFTTTDSLVGRSGKFRIDYETPNYADRLGDGFVLLLSGKPALDPETGEIIEFPKKADAGIYCTTVLKKKFSGWLTIVEYIKDEAPVKLEKVSSILGMA